ncbi:MAG: flagellar biosynthesis protein FlgM [Planctomycetota bacterium]|nr:MAG: flagellar biosynthesis protein FlgM [Planctomycetota bacterium]
MQIYGPSHLHGPQSLQGPHWNRTAAPAPTNRPADQVNISAAAEAALQASETETFRPDLVARIRSQIAAGAYETPDKIAVAVERLLDEIG